MFGKIDLGVRPHPRNRRGRGVREQMVHQCVSEDVWVRTILGIDVEAPPLPAREVAHEFMTRYAPDSWRRAQQLRLKDADWWAEKVTFFDVQRSRAWVMVRRIAQTAHHRGQQTDVLNLFSIDQVALDTLEGPPMPIQPGEKLILDGLVGCRTSLLTEDAGCCRIRDRALETAPLLLLS